MMYLIIQQVQTEYDMSVETFDNVVARMMTRYGGNAALRILTEGEYVDGEVIRSSTDYPVNILLNDFPQANSGEKSKFGTLIEMDDKELFMQPINKSNKDDVQPVVKANRDVIVINNTEWKILALKEINPSGVNTILFDMHLRR